MKNAIRLAAIIILFLSINQAYAEDEGLGKVVIYNFQDKSSTTDYSFYSYVIPDSIAIDIKKTGKLSVKKFPVTFTYKTTRTGKVIQQGNVQLLAERGKELSADYIIVGSYYIRNKEIRIYPLVFNVRTNRLLEIGELKSELGNMLFIIVDKITKEINAELKKYKKKEPDIKEPEVLANSPFLPMYNLINGFTFGLNYGNVSFYGKWKDLYEDGDLVTAYLRYKEYASLDIDYFSSGSSDHTSFSVMSVSANAGYYYPLSKYMQAGVMAGIGYATSELTIDQENGQTKTSSQDPLVNFTAAMRFLYNPIEINFGFSYKQIFYTDESLTVSALFFGLGYRI